MRRIAWTTFLWSYSNISIISDWLVPKWFISLFHFPIVEYVYARYDGARSVHSDSQDPVYYVLEGADPNSSDNKRACDIDRTNERWLPNGNEADLAHVYDTPEGSEADVYEHVYSTIDETYLYVPGQTSPQSPVYVELEGPISGEIEI